VDVDLVGDEDGGGAGEGLGYGDAEVFLVGREGEDLGGVEGSPFLRAFEHACEVNAGGEAEGLGAGAELVGEAVWIGTSEDEVEVG